LIAIILRGTQLGLGFTGYYRPEDMDRDTIKAPTHLLGQLVTLVGPGCDLTFKPRVSRVSIAVTRKRRGEPQANSS
jgi:hypothetical protein